MKASIVRVDRPKNVDKGAWSEKKRNIRNLRSNLDMAKKRGNDAIVAAAQTALDTALKAQIEAVELAKRGIAATAAARDKIMEHSTSLHNNREECDERRHKEVMEKLTKLEPKKRARAKSCDDPYLDTLPNATKDEGVSEGTQGCSAA